MESAPLIRALIFLGSSKKDLEKTPPDVKDIFVDALELAKRGETHDDAKQFKYYGSGVYEVVADSRGSTFRELYTVKYLEVVFVLHIFQKKSKRGSQTPKEEKDLIESRLKWAERVHKEEYATKSKKN